jgi:hypothetical protein
MLTREQINAMEPTELSLAVAEHIFQAKTIGSENIPNVRLLVGHFGFEAWKPMKGNWNNALWRRTDEEAWLDCPRYAEDISSAFEVVEKLQEHHKYVDIRTCADHYEVWITDWSRGVGTEEEVITQTIAHPSLPFAISKCALLTTIQGEQNNA